MDRETATAVPENTVIAPFPYTDESYEMDRNNSQEERSRQRISSNNSGGGSSGGKVNGLSEAQARRILLEQQGGSGSGGGMQDYRWGVRNRKRPLEQDNNSVTQMASMDSTNCTLFLHGLHNDVTGGATLNRDALLNAFGSRGCIRVRYPVSDGYPSYCFLDFETHEDARRCLELNGGQEEILGIHLTMKWSAGKRRVGQQGHHHVVPPPLPPPPPGHVGIFHGGTSTKQQTKSRLREAEAIDSSSLFVHLDCPSMTEEIRSCALASVAGMAQKALEDAINADAGDDRVSADDEPALKVAVRPLQGRLNCGFLDFASHAAASMALATLTGSTDGGLVGTDAASSTISSDEKLSVIKEIQLWWARPKDTSSGKNVDSKGFRFHSHHFPLDARKDCWFCLASPTCEKHLIVSVLDYCYITMPKGPVNQNHALIVPVNHSANEGNNNISVIGAFLDPTPGAIADIERAKEKLRAYAREELNMDLFVFERAIPTRGGYHAHINCIPIEKGSGSKIIPTMLSLAASSNHGKGFELREIQNTDLSVTNILKNADEDELVGYFYAEVPFGVDGVVKRYLYMALDGEHMKDKKRQVPLQFGREVLAAVLGSDTLADWKVCLTSKEKEEEYTEAFRSSFAKFL
jgi:Diadenosine tetraphosphate (Ap4A) hydrolase and other HIT family hydrolases